MHMHADHSEPSTAPPEASRQVNGLFQAYQHSRWPQRLVAAGLAVLLFVIAFAHYESEVDTTSFHPDESRWINRAHYLEDLLDPFGPTWNDQYLTRGQPPMGSYMMGLGLLAQGNDLDTNNAWEYRRGGEWNVANGMYPTSEDLRAGRMTNVFLGSIAVVLAFLAIRLLSNSAGGVVGAIILIFHPLQSWHNRLALADTTLTLTLAALVLALVMLMRKPGWFRALAVSALIGIGGANKLTPMALAFVIAAVGGLVLISTAYRRWQNRAERTPWWSTLPGPHHLSCMLLSTPLIAGVTFVAVYPYLWKRPIENTLKLLDFRQNEMEAQSRLYPQFAVETTGEAIARTWESLADRWSATEWLFSEIGLSSVGEVLSPLDLILAILGMALLVYVAVQSSIRTGHLIVVLVLGVQVATIVLAMRTDFERYYLPIVLTTAIMAGSGVGLIYEGVRRAIADQRSTQPVTPRTRRDAEPQHRAEATRP